MFIIIILFVKFFGSWCGYFGNGYLLGYGERFLEVFIVDYGESCEFY